MAKFWRVAVYEYARHVLRRRFLLALLSVPALVAVMILVGVLTASLEGGGGPVGFVDQSGLLDTSRPYTEPSFMGREIVLYPYASPDQAQAALEAGTIDAFFVLPEGFPSSNRVQLIYNEKPGQAVEEAFEGIVRRRLLAEQPISLSNRLLEGVQLTVRSPDGRQTLSERDWFNVFVPFLAGLTFIIAIFTSGGYLMQAVVEEKENRTVEIMVTSVSPFQMMGGKVVGIIAVGLTQILVWLAFAALALRTGSAAIPRLADVQLNWGQLGLMLLVVMPGFVMIAALMAAVGAAVTEEREGQQITGLFTLPAVIPYWFAYTIMSNPNSPVSLALSYFPLTAPVTLSLRMGFATLPAWSLALNIAVMVVAAAAALWLAGRVFRLGMLQYGKRLSWRELFGRAAEG